MLLRSFNLASRAARTRALHAHAPATAKMPDTLAALLREVPGLVVSFRATPAAAGARGLATGPAASPGQGHPAFTHKTRFNPAPTTDADAPHEMDPAHDLYAIPDRPTDPAMPPNPEAVIRHDHAAREVKRQAAYMGVWEHGAASPEAADVAAHDHADVGAKRPSKKTAGPGGKQQQ